MESTSAAELRQERDRFVAFAFAAADLLLEVDPGGVIRFAAGAAKRLTGRSAEALVGASMEAMLTSADYRLIRQLLVRLGGFPAGLDQVDRLAHAEGTRDDPASQASLRTLAIVGQFATNQDAEASRAFARLVALVERQPDDFHLVWDWTPLREHLAQLDALPIPARREVLGKLLDAVGRENKTAILAGLKEVQKEFTVRAGEPKATSRE